MSFFRFIFLGLVIMTQLIHCTNKKSTEIHGLSYFEILDTLKGIWYIDEIKSPYPNRYLYQGWQQNSMVLYHQDTLIWSLEHSNNPVIERAIGFDILKDNSLEVLTKYGYYTQKDLLIQPSSSWDKLKVIKEGRYKKDDSTPQMIFNDTFVFKKAGPVSIESRTIPIDFDKLNGTTWRAINSEKEYQIAFYGDGDYFISTNYTFFEKDSTGFFAQSMIRGTVKTFQGLLYLYNSWLTDRSPEVEYIQHFGHIPNVDDNIFDISKYRLTDEKSIIHNTKWQELAHPIHSQVSVSTFYLNEKEQLCMISDNEPPIVFEQDSFYSKKQDYLAFSVDSFEIKYYRNDFFKKLYGPRYNSLETSALMRTTPLLISPCHDYAILTSYTLEEQYLEEIGRLRVQGKTDLLDYRIKHRQLHTKCLPIKRTSPEEFEKTGIPFHFVEEN